MNHELAVSELCWGQLNMAKMTITWSFIQEHIVLILAMRRQTLAC